MGAKTTVLVKETDGIKTPLSGLTISKAALALGVLVPIPYCAHRLPPEASIVRKVVKSKYFFISLALSRVLNCVFMIKSVV